MTASDGSAVEQLLEVARRTLPQRPTADELPRLIARGALVVDIRPAENRGPEGEMPGALVVDRNVLEWRLDPTSVDRLPEAVDPDRRVILFCNDGYASSFAAETLRRIGLSRATDLVGGYRAWQALEEH